MTKCQARAALHYDEDAPVATMTSLSGLPERSFKRRFVKVTDLSPMGTRRGPQATDGLLAASPMEYIHTLRLEKAKHMLETTEQPVEAVANKVGDEDSSFFGRLFRRKVGLTPARY